MDKVVCSLSSLKLPTWCPSDLPCDTTSPRPLLLLQPAPPGRSRDRFISLPDELVGDFGSAGSGGAFSPGPDGGGMLSAATTGVGGSLPPDAVPTIFEDLIEEDGSGTRGRITVYCLAEAIDRKALELRLRERGGSFLLSHYPDVLYGLYESTKVWGG